MESNLLALNSFSSYLHACRNEQCVDVARDEERCDEHPRGTRLHFGGAQSLRDCRSHRRFGFAQNGRPKSERRRTQQGISYTHPTHPYSLLQAIETYCVDAGDLSLHFVQFEKDFSIESNPRHLDLYRFKETAKTENPDTVHLNYRGVQKLQGLIEAEVSKAVKVNNNNNNNNDNNNNNNNNIDKKWSGGKEYR